MNTAIASVNVIRRQNELCLALAGAFSCETVHVWREALEAAATAGVKRVVLDLAEVSTLDSAGLGAIAFLFKRLLSRGCSLVLTSVAGQPLAMLHELGLTRLLGLQTTTARPAARQRRLGGIAWAGAR